MIHPKIQNKIERETERIRKEMGRPRSALEFIFGKKSTPDFMPSVRKQERELLGQRGYVVKDAELQVPSERRVSIYLPGNKIFNNDGKPTSAVFSTYYLTAGNGQKSIINFDNVDLNSYLFSLDVSGFIQDNIRAEVLREIVGG